MSAGGVPLLEHSLLGMELVCFSLSFPFSTSPYDYDEYKSPVIAGPCGRFRYGLFVCKIFSDLTLK